MIIGVRVTVNRSLWLTVRVARLGFRVRSGADVRNGVFLGGGQMSRTFGSPGRHLSP